MPGQAFDGSIWVASGQVLGLVGGSVLLAGTGALLLARAQLQRPQMMPLSEFQGRRKMPLRMEGRNGQLDKTPRTIDAETLEEILTDEQERSPEEAVKDVSTKPKQ